MHAAAVTASRSMPAAAGQLSVRTMANCYNCCAHSLPAAAARRAMVRSDEYLCTGGAYRKHYSAVSKQAGAFRVHKG